MQISNGVKKIFLIIFLTLLFFPLLGWALDYPLVPCGQTEDDLDSPYNETDPCTLCYLFVLFKNIIDFLLFTIVPPLAILMIAIAGAMFLFAAGNPSTLNQAKSILTSTGIALIIIYGAWLLLGLIFSIIGVASWTGLAGGWRQGWFEFPCP